MSATGKKLVVYYSWGNNTKAAAEYLQQKLGADILQVQPKKPYPPDYNACVREVGRAGKEFEPELIDNIPDLSEYDVFFIGSPCWWGTIANPVRTFLHQNDFAGKTIVPFMTHGTSGLHVGDIKILCPEARVHDGLGIFNSYQVSTKKNTPDNMGDYRSDIDRWLVRIGF